MTPAARIEAAIGVLDRILGGMAAEKALTNWARSARYAGSKDRAALRDHVFDVLRQWRSCAALGGGESGRALMIGLLRLQGQAPEAFFTGEGHAPKSLLEEEAMAGCPPQAYDAWDMPDWLCARLEAGYGNKAHGIAAALRSRAAVFLRVNTLKADPVRAQAALLTDGIETIPHALSRTALQVTSGARRVAQSQAYQRGLVELQDAASQAVCDLLPLQPGMRVLDYCAGGGGKSIAMAARLSGPVEAHDASPARMKDLSTRAARAGAEVIPVAKPKGLYDLVLCDVPCSGSGAWRRSPEGKWRLTPEDLDALCALQLKILQECSAFLAPGGVLAYATCSLLPEENEAVIEAFLHRAPGWRRQMSRQFLPEEGGDGFFTASLVA